MGEVERPVNRTEDETWPYDPAWVELAEPPLERLRREELDQPAPAPRRYPAAPTKKPTIAP